MGDLQLTPALLIALFERPHDRHFIVQLEDSMMSFMNSHVESYQLEPMNSYYRLLAHQIAEYHGLRHTLAKSNDSCIVIFKGTSFTGDANKPMLQELDPPFQYEYSTSPYSANNDGYKKYKILRRESQNINDLGPTTQEGDMGLDENMIARQQQYEQRKNEIFDGPTTPQKPTDFVDDDSPQPHQFETSRYKFKQQAYKPKKKKSYKKQTNYPILPMYYQSAPAAYPMPYMMYNPYAMMFVPPEHPYPQMPLKCRRIIDTYTRLSKVSTRFFSPGSLYSSRNSSDVSIKKKDQKSNSQIGVADKSSESSTTGNTRSSLMEATGPHGSSGTSTLDDVNNQLEKLSI